jgi:hypothetical protein
MTAFLGLLLRSHVAKSQAVTELEARTTLVLEEARRRKWNPNIEDAVSLFPGSSKIGDAWILVKEHAEELLRETFEPALWFGGDGDAKTPSQIEEKCDRDNLAAIERFMWGIFLAEGRNISKTDIWTVAGYSDDTQFGRYQRDDKRTSRTARKNFERVLKLSPEVFLRLLDKVKPK